jgi:hypothetical protein
MGLNDIKVKLFDLSCNHFEQAWCFKSNSEDYVGISDWTEYADGFTAVSVFYNDNEEVTRVELMSEYYSDDSFETMSNRLKDLFNINRIYCSNHNMDISDYDENEIEERDLKDWVL